MTSFRKILCVNHVCCSPTFPVHFCRMENTSNKGSWWKRSHGAFVSLGHELLLLGGRDDSYNRLTTAVSYNWTNGVWNTLCSLPHRTSGCAAAVVDSNRVVVVGSASFNTSKSAWMYDDKNKSWSALPDLQVGRWNHACVCVDGKVYAIGGLEQDTIEVLDFSTAAATTSGWKLLPERMKKRRFGCSATVDCNGNIVVTGGYNDADGHLDSVEVFDTGHQVWTNKVPHDDTPRQSLHRCTARGENACRHGRRHW